MNSAADIVKEKQNRDAMLRRSLERNIQLYTDKAHFIYELLQNAEDAKATQVRFIQYSDRLEVFHDGNPFTAQNLLGLCDIGLSDKVEDLNQIGEFGVGFKSVFGICETVRLYSNPEHFKGKMTEKPLPEFAVEIKDFITPEDIDKEPMDNLYTTRFVFPYSAGLSFSGFKDINTLNKVLLERLQNLGISTLLFMKNLKVIDYQIYIDDHFTRGEYLLEKTPLGENCELVSALGSSTGLLDENISYLKFSRDLDRFPGRTVDIAFSVVEEFGGYTCVKSRDPFVSVYFPTETESKLNFIVQGPYRTAPNRSSIPADDEDNLYLAKETAKLLRSSILYLIKKQEFNMSFVKFLPLFDEAFENYNLFYPLYQTVLNIFKYECSIPCKDGGFTYAKFSKIARPERLATVFNNELLTELIDDGEEYKWLPTYLTSTSREYASVYRFFSGTLKIEVIAPEDLRKFFANNEEFLKERSNDWLVELYAILESIPAAFKKSSSPNMLCSKIVKTSTGKIVAPYRKEDNSYILDVFIKKTKFNVFDINYLDEDLYNRCRNFFVDVLGITTPPEYEIGINDLRKRLENGYLFNEETHIHDLKFILKFINNDDYHDEVEKFLKERFALRCKDGIMHNAFVQKVFLPKCGDINIEYYYQNTANPAFFVDLEYYLDNGIDEKTLLQFGVLDSIIIGEDITNGIYEIGGKKRPPSWWTTGDFRWKFSIDNLRNVLKYISEHPFAKDSIIKSQTILKLLFENENRLCGKVSISGGYSDLDNEYCELIHVLRKDRMFTWDGKWVYTNSNELVSPRMISKNDLSVAYYGQIKSDSRVYDYLGFKKTKEDEVDALKRQFSSDEIDALFESELIKRFGISSLDLEEKYGYSQSSQEFVSEERIFTFPVAKVKNWEALKKHAEEMFCYADPVRYEKVLRSIRTSSRKNDAKAYLRNMYRYDDSYRYACQLCHEPCASNETVELFYKPELELDPLHLSLCPNCAAEYRNLRLQSEFIETIRTTLLTRDISFVSEDYIKIDVAEKELWFTQTHFAEIQELLKLIKEVKEKSLSVSSQGNTQEVDASNWFEQYIGKVIKRKAGGFEGVISKIEGNFVYIRVKNGDALEDEKPYSLSTVFKENGIYIIES